jgi:hypothetical protein
MKLIANWQRVIRKAWSFRLMLLAGFLSGAEVILPLFIDSIPRNVFAGLSLVTVMGAMVARVVAQRDMNDDAEK